MQSPAVLSALALNSTQKGHTSDVRYALLLLGPSGAVAFTSGRDNVFAETTCLFLGRSTHLQGEALIALEGHHVAHSVTVAHLLSVTGRQRLGARIQTYCLGQSHNTQVWTAIILLHTTRGKVIQRVGCRTTSCLPTASRFCLVCERGGNERNYNKTKTTWCLISLHLWGSIKLCYKSLFYFYFFSLFPLHTRNACELGRVAELFYWCL